MNQYLKSVKSKNKYREFLKVLNGVLQLSDREVDVLSILLQLDVEWGNNFNLKNILSTDSRKAVMSSTKINKNNLTKYIVKFKSLGILRNTTDKTWIVNEMFVPQIENNKVTISFILDINE